MFRSFHSLPRLSLLPYNCAVHCMWLWCALRSNSSTTYMFCFIWLLAEVHEVKIMWTNALLTQIGRLKRRWRWRNNMLMWLCVKHSEVSVTLRPLVRVSMRNYQLLISVTIFFSSPFRFHICTSVTIIFNKYKLVFFCHENLSLICLKFPWLFFY